MPISLWCRRLSDSPAQPTALLACARDALNHSPGEGLCSACHVAATCRRHNCRGWWRYGRRRIWKPAVLFPTLWFAPQSLRLLRLRRRFVSPHAHLPAPPRQTRPWQCSHRRWREFITISRLAPRVFAAQHGGSCSFLWIIFVELRWERLYSSHCHLLLGDEVARHACIKDQSFLVGLTPVN